MDSDDFREAVNMERPFKELYQNLAWLNHYAVTNILAIEHALNQIQTDVFLARPEFNMLTENFIQIINNNELKKSTNMKLSYLDDIARDIVHFYSIFFTEGDRK